MIADEKKGYIEVFEHPLIPASEMFVMDMVRQIDKVRGIGMTGEERQDICNKMLDNFREEYYKYLGM